MPEIVRSIMVANNDLSYKIYDVNTALCQSSELFFQESGCYSEDSNAALS